MFFLTIYGAEVIRKAAFLMAILIIAGLIAIYGANLIARFPQMIEIIRQTPSHEGFGQPLWIALVYAGFQSTLIGVYVAVADVLKTKKDALKTTVLGFIINGGILWLASVVLLSFYPAILSERVPVLYMVKQGVGSGFTELIISFLILLGDID